MAAAWADFLQGSPSPGHAVQVYQDAGELADSVGAYLAAGFEAGEPAVVVATPEHWELFAAELARRGWPVAEVEAHGLLTLADAEATLGTFMDGAAPSPRRFEQVVGGLVDRAAGRRPRRHVRVFGEMVDVLCRQGDPDAALALEEL